jgi:hypothetical protein
MNNELKHELLAGYIDGELSAEEKALFEQELENNPSLKKELEEFKQLKDLTNSMQYDDLPDEVWESYWQSLYKKLERSTGWILFSVSTILLLFYGAFNLLKEMYINPDISLFIKIAVTSLVAGLIILLVSYIRERLFAYKRERYTEVMK